MSLEHDPRTGREESGSVTIASGDGSTPQTVLDVPSGALFRPTGFKVEYAEAGTTDDDVEIYDDADQTTAANVSDQRETFRDLGPDTRREVDGTWREFENDVLAKTAGNHDGDITVTVYGIVLTDLKDISGM